MTIPNKAEPLALPRYSECFVCGRSNPIGLDVVFYYNNNRIETTFTATAAHCGYRNIVHGGILATLLDECMGWAGILSRCIMCYGAELSVRYKQSAKAGDKLLIYSDLVVDKKRLILAKGAIEREDGTLLCTAEGKFIPLSSEELDETLNYAQWGDVLKDTYEKIRSIQMKNNADS